MESDLDINAMVDSVRDILNSHRNIVETNAQIVRFYNTILNRYRTRTSQPVREAHSPIRTRRTVTRFRVDDFNTPVEELVQENGMTPEQIPLYTTEGTFLQLREDNTERRCPISWTQLQDTTPVIKINGCGHIFTPDALKEWLLLHSTCPTCRYNLLPESQGGTEPVGLDLRAASQTARIFADILSGSPIQGMESLASIAQRIERNVPNNLN